MARPASDPEQRMSAYLVYEKLGPRPTAIREQLTLDYGEADVMSLRTISNWVAEFKTIDASLDAPFEWHKMEEYGLPWEAGEFLLGMWMGYQETFMQKQHLPDRAPTGRQVRWWWRVHLAVPELQPIDIAYVAQRYATREMATAVLREPLDMADLDAWLTYQGWAEFDKFGDSTRHNLYLTAVKMGTIPPLKTTTDSHRQAARVHAKTKGSSDLLFAIESIGQDPEHPELLPRRQLGKLREEHSI